MKPDPSPEIVNPLRGRCRGTLLPAALGVIVLLGAVSSPLMARVKIEHKPIKKSTSGQRIAVEAEIGDRSAGIREARAYFKSGFDHRFWFAPMRQDHRGQFVGILPAPSVGAGTVQYQIYAVNGANDFVKTQIYTIDIEDDRQALARAQARQPTDVEIDLDRIEQLRDLARRAGEPNPEQRVEVRNDVPDSPNPQALHGFEDYIVMAHAQPAAAGAGLAGASAVKASAGGIGMGKILGGAILLGGVAVAANEYLDDDEGGVDQSVQCDATARQGSSAPERVGVELGRRSGQFDFRWEMHGVPDRMIVEYEGRTLFDTGCVSGPGLRTISYSGSRTNIVVDVRPTCDGSGRGTAWNFTVNCPR